MGGYSQGLLPFFLVSCDYALLSSSFVSFALMQPSLPYWTHPQPQPGIRAGHQIQASKILPCLFWLVVALQMVHLDESSEGQIALLVRVQELFDLILRLC